MEFALICRPFSAIDGTLLQAAIPTEFIDFKSIKELTSVPALHVRENLADNSSHTKAEILLHFRNGTSKTGKLSISLNVLNYIESHELSKYCIVLREIQPTVKRNYVSCLTTSFTIRLESTIPTNIHPNKYEDYFQHIENQIKKPNGIKDLDTSLTQFNKRTPVPPPSYSSLRLVTEEPESSTDESDTEEVIIPTYVHNNGVNTESVRTMCQLTSNFSALRILDEIMKLCSSQTLAPITMTFMISPHHDLFICMVKFMLNQFDKQTRVREPAVLIKDVRKKLPVLLDKRPLPVLECIRLMANRDTNLAVRSLFEQTFLLHPQDDREAIIKDKHQSCPLTQTCVFGVTQTPSTLKGKSLPQSVSQLLLHILVEDVISQIS